jgi:hypothetical protein
MIFTLNSFFLKNQTKTLLETDFVSAPKQYNSKIISTKTELKRLANLNLFFLQKTLTPISNLSTSSSGLELLFNSNSSTNKSFISSDFITKLHLVSNNQPETNQYNIFISNESNFTLNTDLNAGFLKNTTFSLTLDKNKMNKNDPMQSESIFTGLNNIAKQQR